MDAGRGQDLFCPRCRYNLRGLNVPRCPECGLTFLPEDWEAGVLRENVATGLDRCDPWQPHQVLIRSLHELVRGVLRPGWVINKLDLKGPLWAAGVMLVCGMVWLCVLTVMLVGAATVVHTGASPAAALRWTGMVWGPRVVAVALISSGVVFGMLVLLRMPRLLRPGWREYARLLGYWMPSAALWAVAALGVGLLAVGDTAPEFWRPWSLWTGVPAAGVLWRGLWRGSGVRLWCFAAMFGAWMWGCPALAKFLLPRSLEVGMWVYWGAS